MNKSVTNTVYAMIVAGIVLACAAKVSANSIKVIANHTNILAIYKMLNDIKSHLIRIEGKL